MTTEDDTGAPWLSDETLPTLVGDGDDAHPFMVGILVHSLVKRGVSFSNAYAAASHIAGQLRGEVRTQRHELAAAVRDILGHDPYDQKTIPNPVIQVLWAGTRVPFSKRTMANSLSAAAIEPGEAFVMAQTLEQELIARAVIEIDRAELRTVAHDLVLRRAGEEAARRYLVWRRYDEPETPLFLLLGGTSGVGKTTLALEVARRLGIGRVISTDSIRQVMRLMISRDLMPAIHASSYDAHRVLDGYGGRAVSVIDGYRAQATFVAVGVKASLDRGVDESANVVMDGALLLPGVVDVERYSQQAVVVFCVVATLDESALRDRFQNRASGQRHRQAHRYLENFEAILAIQRHLIEEAERRGIPVIDNIDVDASARTVLAHVMDKLRSMEAP
mgnify:CR=1 FL=1